MKDKSFFFLVLSFALILTVLSATSVNADMTDSLRFVVDCEGDVYEEITETYGNNQASITHSTGDVNGQWCEFDGSSYSSINDTAGFDGVGWEALTISVWLNSSDLTTDYLEVFSKWTGDTNGWAFYTPWATDNNVAIRMWTNTDTDFDQTLAEISEGTTYHMLMRWSASTNTAELWIDGTNTGNISSKDGDYLRNNDVNIFLGADPGDGTPSNIYNGKADEFYIWNRSLSDEEIANLVADNDTSYYPFSTATPATVPEDEIKFLDSVPADITSQTPFSYDNITFTYYYFNTSNLTDPYELNASVVSQVSSCINYLNGSCSLLNNTWVKFSPTSITNNSNQSSNVTYTLDEHDLFTHDENFDVLGETTLYETSFLTMDTSNDDWHAEQFLNVSTKDNYTIYLEVPIETDGLVNVYLANDTADFEQSEPQNQPGVVDICSITSDTTSNHSHTYNGTSYNHTVCRTEVVDGKIGTVPITSEMWVLIEATSGTVELFQIDSLVRAGSARYSSNNGGSWSDGNNAFIHYHFISSSDSVKLVAFSNRSDDVFLNSSLRTDTYEVDNPPTNPDITVPVNGADVNASINFTWRGDTDTVYYNVTLLNSDLSLNKTLNANNSDALNFTWNVYDEAETYLGEFFIRIQAINPLGTTQDIHGFNITANARVNITAKKAVSGATINTFEGWVYRVEDGQNVSYSTTNGVAYADLVRGNITVWIDATNYSLNDSYMYLNTSNPGQTNASYVLYETNTINITFYDQAAPTTILSGTTISMDLISDIYSNNYSTSNGTLYLTLLQPTTYTLRYSASGFSERFYSFTLTNRTYNTLSLYLINGSETTNISVFVIDDITNPVEGAFVHALKYDLNTNTYILQEIGQTDVAGKTIMSLTKNDEFYKFLVYYNDILRFTSTPAYITTDEYTIQINFDEDIAEDIFNYWTISGTLAFNTATDNFRLDFSDSTGITSEFCVKVDRYRNITKTADYNTSCTTSASGTILVGVVAENGTRYVATAYYTESGEETYLDSDSYTYPDVQANLGANGLIMQAIFTMIFTLLALKSLALASILAPFTLILGNMVGLNQFSMAALIAVQAIGVFLAYVFSKKG